MAKENYVHLLGVIQRKPVVQVDGEGNYRNGLFFLKVIRGPRQVGDNRYTAKYDEPVVMSFDPERVKEMASFEENDVIEVKGVIAVKPIMKSSTCGFCGARNSVQGTLVYVCPLDMFKVKHIESEEEMNTFLNERSEISNEILCFCTLVRDPKKITPKSGLTVTQYQVALNRKFRITTDPPEVKADYPWVKSYGDNAQSDRERLHVGSEIFVDGCLQARGVNRHTVCANCGQRYDWKDKAMEIVPFACEYVNNYYSDADIERMKQEAIEEAKRSVFKTMKNAPSEVELQKDDIITDDDLEAGFDTNGQ